MPGVEAHSAGPCRTPPLKVAAQRQTCTYDLNAHDHDDDQSITITCWQHRLLGAPGRPLFFLLLPPQSQSTQGILALALCQVHLHRRWSLSVCAPSLDLPPSSSARQPRVPLRFHAKLVVPCPFPTHLSPKTPPFGSLVLVRPHADAPSHPLPVFASHTVRQPVDPFCSCRTALSRPCLSLHPLLTVVHAAFFSVRANALPATHLSPPHAILFASTRQTSCEADPAQFKHPSSDLHCSADWSPSFTFGSP